MADYQMAQRGTATVVSIVGYDGPRLPLIQAFQACRDGKCTCATDDVDHLDDLEVDERDGRIELTLRPVDGVALDRESVVRSLESTLTRFDNVSI